MRIHLIGIGGVAMGNLAAMLRDLGHQVSGSDKALYPPMSDRLKDWKIEARPFGESNLKGAELVVVGNAVSRGNIEVETMLNLGLPYLSMPQALREFALKDKQVVVIAGTHGKTTTTFLVDHVLAHGKEGKPGLFAGGVRADGMDGFRISPRSPYFVIEGDEYDTAFFDRGPKFLHYRPRFLALTAIEYDHADIYPDEASYMQSYQRLLRLIPSQGLVVACASDAGVRAALDHYDLAPVEWYASKEFAALKQKLSPHGKVQTFTRVGRSVSFDFPGRLERFALIGAHNTGNALAAALIGRQVGVPQEKIREALVSFPGVLRRQQVRVETDRSKGAGGPVTFIEDFAHHPTAVAATIAALREAYPGRRVHALFEPRSASSHRSVFHKQYATAFAQADSAYLCDVFDRNKVEAGLRLDVKKLVADIKTQSAKRGKAARGFEAQFARDPDALVEVFRKRFKPSADGDVVVAMSNGAFGGIYKKVDEFIRGV
ncbi:MAG: UDP-N-acetylmuramate--alanine ligase [Leptospirales bacterium]|nr:UDP-N-acetylmuramate--alanine ligase [Leptospirales bacterium]